LIASAKFTGVSARNVPRVFDELTMKMTREILQLSWLLLIRNLLVDNGIDNEKSIVYNRDMHLRDEILKLAQDSKKIKSKDLVERYKVSRQYVNTVIKSLVIEEKLIKIGSTRYAFYVHPKFANSFKTKIKKRFTNKNLKEHEVLDKLEKRSSLIRSLPENIRSILNYAFLEMLNNAIEHSESANVEIEIEKDSNLIFHVNDFGIGVFKNIMRKRHLKSELEAVQDLLKGKTTTAPQAHSGEGIFFTSKIADVFTLQSYNYKLIIDNLLKDIFFEEIKPAKRGTKVSFQISNDSAKHLIDVLRQYQSDPEEKAFDKTEIQIKLYMMGTIHISRSQARRVLAGLDKFKLIILDFDKVPNIGQAFADEVFRVFKKSHPSIQLKPMNMNEAVQFMIERVGK